MTTSGRITTRNGSKEPPHLYTAWHVYYFTLFNGTSFLIVKVNNTKMQTGSRRNTSILTKG